mmetsp:Transcript_36793/g.109598  ORF Transcript_36793/g.109598 Transcript_36793/m.109598 type:complete len:228 (+) Transcript_36793:74-757(+)
MAMVGAFTCRISQPRTGEHGGERSPPADVAVTASSAPCGSRGGKALSYSSATTRSCDSSSSRTRSRSPGEKEATATSRPEPGLPAPPARSPDRCAEISRRTSSAQARSKPSSSVRACKSRACAVRTARKLRRSTSSSRFSFAVISRYLASASACLCTSSLSRRLDAASVSPSVAAGATPPPQDEEGREGEAASACTRLLPAASASAASAAAAAAAASPAAPESSSSS